MTLLYKGHGIGVLEVDSVSLLNPFTNSLFASCLSKMAISTFLPKAFYLQNHSFRNSVPLLIIGFSGLPLSLLPSR